MGEFSSRQQLPPKLLTTINFTCCLQPAQSIVHTSGDQGFSFDRNATKEFHRNSYQTCLSIYSVRLHLSMEKLLYMAI